MGNKKKKESSDSSDSEDNKKKSKKSSSISSDKRKNSNKSDKKKSVDFPKVDTTNDSSDITCAFVGGLPYSIDDNEMGKWLKKNKIHYEKMDMPKFEDSGRPKGLAFIHMSQ